MEPDSKISFDVSWSDIEAILGGAEAIDALAVETGALVRRRHIRSGSQLLRLALGYATTGRSLRSTAAWSATALDAAISDVAVMERLQECGDFLDRLVGRLLALSTDWAEPLPLWQGPPIRLVDGSMFSGRRHRRERSQLRQDRRLAGSR